MQDNELEIRKRLSEKLRAKLGFHFPEDRLDELYKRLQPSFNQLQITAQSSGLLSLLMSEWDQKVIDALVPHLSIGETYFFRDPSLWREIELEMLPGFIRLLRRGERKKINIWSAACCTGEEPYTLAMILKGMLAGENREAFSIYASDLNKDFLAEAEMGEYAQWSLRATPEQAKSQFFKVAGKNKYRVTESVKDMVKFFYHNLIDMRHPLNQPELKFDLILCRNVLMYFEGKQSARVVERLLSLLNEGGFLVLSPHEYQLENYRDAEVLVLSDTILLRKRSGHSESRPRISQPYISPPIPQPVLPVLNDAVNESPAQFLAKIGKYSEAARHLSLEAENGAATENDFRLLIQCLSNSADIKGALDWSDAATKKFPLAASFYYTRSNLLAESGDIKAAIKSLQQAVFLEPDFVMAHFALYNLYGKTGKAQQAEVSFANVQRLLGKCKSGEELPESDGLTAGQLTAIIKSREAVNA